MDALTLLRLQVEWGADEAIDAEPVDRLAARDRAPAATVTRLAPFGPAPIGAPRSVGTTPPVAPAGTPAERAFAAAARAADLDALRVAIAAFDGCALRDTASHLVFATGDPSTGLLMIGEPPAAEEDRAGTPFAGREGDLFDRMLASIGLTRAGMLLAPLIPWRPPGGRPPNAGEITVCLPFLHRVIALAAPERIVIWGSLAARTLLGAAAGRRRGTASWVDCAVPGVPGSVPALVLPGLTELLKTPLRRKDAWAGLRLLRRTMDAAAVGPGQAGP